MLLPDEALRTVSSQWQTVAQARGPPHTHQEPGQQENQQFECCGTPPSAPCSFRDSPSSMTIVSRASNTYGDCPGKSEQVMLDTLGSLKSSLGQRHCDMGAPVNGDIYWFLQMQTHWCPWAGRVGTLGAKE